MHRLFPSLATFLRPHHPLSPRLRSSHHTSSFSTLRSRPSTHRPLLTTPRPTLLGPMQKYSMSYTPWSHLPRPSSLPTLPTPTQSYTTISPLRPTNFTGLSPSSAWRLGGQRGMKVRSSVKKLCEGCKVRFPSFPGVGIS